MTLAPKVSAEDRALILGKLQRLGIDSLEQALLCVPRGFLDYSEVTTLRAALPKDGVTTSNRLFSLIVSETAIVIQQPKKRVQLTATDGMLSVRISIFLVAGVDLPYWKSLRVGDRFHIAGSLQSWAGRLQITGPIPVQAHQIGKILPIYQGKRGVVAAESVHNGVRYAIHNVDAAVHHLIAHFDGLTEREILTHAKLTAPDLRALLNGMHQPQTIEEGEAAIIEARKLAAFGVVWAAKRQKRRPPCPASVIPVTMRDIKELAAKLPKQLTQDQIRTIREICADLVNVHPMRRVLSGDVGCGKTFAYMLPALAVQRMGKLVAILTPNSLLVEQFVSECREIYGEDLPIVAITGASKKQKVDMSNNPILVGTTALLDWLRKQGLTPAFLVVDEQQKFSVEQKAALSVEETNLLEATATPIPRTTALVTHGSMDVSIIRECPVAKNIITRIVKQAEVGQLFAHTRKVIAAGGQVAVIYPIVDDDAQERKSVVAAYDRWNAEFPGRVGLVHGGMKEGDKTAVITRLKAGELSVCLSTTVIELGLTMPSLKSMVVVNAERYGVAQLHQLRGRAARLGGTGYFFLFLPQAIGDDTMDRLKLVEETSDGFVLAERDSQKRGYGDLTEDSDRQHGNSRSMLFFGIELRPEDIHQFAGT